MRKNIRSTNLRFNLDKDLQRQAWQYLQIMDKKHFKSYSHAIALSVVEYFERYYRKEDDPYFETRQREEQFVEQIIRAVEKAMEKTLPVFLAGYLSGIGQVPAATDTSQQEQTDLTASLSAALDPEPTSEEVDWNFLGE